MKTIVDLGLRLELNRKCSNKEIWEVVRFIADLLDVDDLYHHEFGTQETKLKVKHHFVSRLSAKKRLMYTPPKPQFSGVFSLFRHATGKRLVLTLEVEPEQNRGSVVKYKKYKWRIYADSNITRDVVELLRKSGINVLWVDEDPKLKRHRDDEFHYVEAAKRRRYLLTSDRDFWDDRRFPLFQSPGLIWLDSDDPQTAKVLTIVLKKLVTEHNPTPEPVYLSGTKTKLSSEGVSLKLIDRNTGKRSILRWPWSELI